MSEQPYEYDGLAQRDTWATLRLQEYARTGDLRLRDEVYDAYCPLTRITAHRIPHPVQEHEDIVQEACIGLLKAICEWNPARGTRFSTWAICKMRFACVEYIRNEIWGTRSMQDKVRTVKRRLTEIENGAPMTAEEVANGGPLMPPAFAMVPLSMDQKLRMGAGDAGDADCYLRDQVTDQINCEFAAMQNLLHTEVRESLAWLPARQQGIFRLYYQEGKTFREIGVTMGISESRVFQLHQQGMRRLRGRMSGAAESGATDPYTKAEDRANGRAFRRPARRGQDKIAVRHRAVA